MHLTRRRKTGFVGLLVAINSVNGIFSDLVEKENAPLKYVLTHKFSQDHLDLFFEAVRSAGGFNNNPTTQQFTAAYKRLLARSSIQSSGNCQNQDSTQSLSCLITDSCFVNNNEIGISSTALRKKYNLDHIPVLDHDYCSIPQFNILSEFKRSAISYISGYVAKMASKDLPCKLL